MKTLWRTDSAAALCQFLTGCCSPLVPMLWYFLCWCLDSLLSSHTICLSSTFSFWWSFCCFLCTLKTLTFHCLVLVCRTMISLYILILHASICLNFLINNVFKKYLRGLVSIRRSHTSILYFLFPPVCLIPLCGIGLSFISGSTAFHQHEPYQLMLWIPLYC